MVFVYSMHSNRLVKEVEFINRMRAASRDLPNNKTAVNKRDAGSLQSYFVEISRIPLLTHGDETALAKRLAACRKRLYRGILATGHGLQAIVTLLDPVCRGAVRIDRVLELSSPGVEEKHRVLEYLTPTVVVLHRLLVKNQSDFALTMDKGQAAPLRRLASQRLTARYTKAMRLLEGITIRRQHIMPILAAVRQISQRLDYLGKEVNKAQANPRKRDRAGELQKELSQLMQTALETPSSLCRRLQRITRRNRDTKPQGPICRRPTCG